MKKLLFILVCLLIAGSAPACTAAYMYNWTSGFESPTNNPGPLDGQDGWYTPDHPNYTNEQTMDVVAGAGLNAGQGLVERNGVSLAARDMWVPDGAFFMRGYAKFWVYDPGYSLNSTEARVGLYGSSGPGTIHNMVTAQIQDDSARDPNYWYAQWSYSVGKMDGATAIAPQAGYTFTQGLAAPRVWQAWSYVLITWAYSYTIPRDPTSGGNGTIKWYINQTSVTPNLTLNFDSTSSRWAGFHDVVGIYLGSGQSTTNNRRPARFDDIEFHSDPVYPPEPEPTGLLVLACGSVLICLLRLRRKVESP